MAGQSQNRLTVKAQGVQYDVIAGKGIIGQAANYLQEHSRKKAVVISDTNVAPLYMEILQGQLEKLNITVIQVIVPGGEASKSHEVLVQLYRRMAQEHITRNDIVIALGGGVIGDLAGYAAATFLRGVPMVQVPTTLLAQVDSSVGGKVAVNLPEGKNLVGSFMQPVFVLADTQTLQTLPERQLLSGVAEVVKYGCIYDISLLDYLIEENLSAERLANVVLTCCQIKAAYVEEDPFDKGIRMQLNFGHTLGHAIETVGGYGRYLHGEGVAVGMVAAARWGEELKVTPQGTGQRITDILKSLGLPVRSPVRDLAALEDVMLNDKKSQNDQIHIVLLERLGKACTMRISKKELGTLMRRTLP